MGPNSSPEKALRFSSLYSRLLSIPVISQKWAVLYFLYQLGDQPQAMPPTLTSPFKSPVKKREKRQLEANKTPESPDYGSRREKQQLHEAFAPEGLKQLPTREGGQRDKQEEAQAFAKNAAAQREGVSLKTALLAENYVEIDPPETALLRDLPFTLQTSPSLLNRL